MINITVYNESENDRRAIMEFFSSDFAGKAIDLNEFVLQRTITFILTDYSLIWLESKDIIYFEYINRKIRIVTQEQEYICMNERIGDIARRMQPYGFFMSHQSFVVNLYAIAGIREQELLMKNGDTVYLAQKRAASIRKELRSQRGKILL